MVVALSLSCQGTPEPSSGAKQGGRLVVAQPSGPKTFNPLYADDNNSLTVLGLMQATLIYINRQTQETELGLAESADFSPDGRVLTMRLRPDLKFSDGHPLTADDVLFTFQVIYDPNVPSSVADLVKIGGQPIQVEKIDDRTIRFTLPEPAASTKRLFDTVNVFPKHLLEPVYREGQFESVWGLDTPPEQVLSTGPFRLQSYEPGQRTVLTRNPYYWKRDNQGNQLPYLDGIDLLIIPDKSTQLLKFQQGELDLLYPLQAEDVPSLQPLVDRGEVTVVDLGASLITELLWFNLNTGRRPQAGKPYVDPAKMKWFSEVKFRQAVASAIDRDAIVDVVFSGKAKPLLGFVSPGETQWHNPPIKSSLYDLDRARQLLDQLGFRDRDQNGIREDEQGNPIKFTLVTNAGNTLREKMGLLIQEDLKQVGIEVTFVPVEVKVLLGKIFNDFDYEACLFSLQSGDTDPNSKLNFLLSSGNLHYWYPEQKTPATPLDAEIDQLMTQQAKTLDGAERKEIFDRVQQLMAEQLPVIPLVARNLIIAARQRVGNIKPGILHDSALWNSEELFLR